ncbi:DNA alkylation repair protein [Lawsonella clevelandensis]|uniref:DNA alkylation repair protein n=1 Tax=Lawsonella clevelandensis TaxID=1528099 RepID=A0A0M5KZJ1_9ACTN|nr:DNA alkylation repair protein [Lawsonella clevelandensis]ALE18922.1 hypothetical protein AL705_03845 [Lawsonella clevelandensis]MDU7194175.1 DNA alkylation repair protein [Lawsonella clevelandensis]
MCEHINTQASSANELRTQLEELGEPPLRSFNARLVPTESDEALLGIRIPTLRQIAKDLWRHNRPLADAFLSDLPHRYLEENLLHMLLLNQLRDADEYATALEPFLPHITNWMVSDAAGPKLPTEELQRLEPYLRTWLADSHTYTSRVGGVLLMSNYLRDLFRPEHLQWVARIPSQDYYSHMLQGWYLATALVTQPDAIWPVLRDPEAAGVPLSVEARLKAIQKSIESRRISAGDKTELRALRAAIRGRHA